MHLYANRNVNRVKEPRLCLRCGAEFFRHGGNTDAKYCSRLCACRDRNTLIHQKKAGKFGALYNIGKRGTGAKTYVKFYGRHIHRIVMETALGRPLVSSEIVHHIDNNKHNNNAENLRLLSRAEHAKVHFHGKA